MSPPRRFSRRPPSTRSRAAAQRIHPRAPAAGARRSPRCGRTRERGGGRGTPHSAESFKPGKAGLESDAHTHTFIHIQISSRASPRLWPGSCPALTATSPGARLGRERSTHQVGSHGTLGQHQRAFGHQEELDAGEAGHLPPPPPLPRRAGPRQLSAARRAPLPRHPPPGTAAGWRPRGCSAPSSSSSSLRVPLTAAARGCCLSARGLLPWPARRLLLLLLLPPSLLPSPCRAPSLRQPRAGRIREPRRREGRGKARGWRRLRRRRGGPVPGYARSVPLRPEPSLSRGPAAPQSRPQPQGSALLSAPSWLRPLRSSCTRTKGQREDL